MVDEQGAAAASGTGQLGRETLAGSQRRHLVQAGVAHSEAVEQALVHAYQLLALQGAQRVQLQALASCAYLRSPLHLLDGAFCTKELKLQTLRFTSANAKYDGL